MVKHWSLTQEVMEETHVYEECHVPRLECQHQRWLMEQQQQLGIDVSLWPSVAWPMKFGPVDQKVKTNHRWWPPLPPRWRTVGLQSRNRAVVPPSFVAVEEVVVVEVTPFEQGGHVGKRVLLVSLPAVEQ